MSSPNWDNPTGPVANVGAVTLCNGTGGTVGLVTVANSLIGGRANDNVGDPGSSVFNRSGVYVLANGNYVVSSNNWDNPSPSRSDVGAVTFCNGMSGCTGLVTASNSLIGGTAGDKIGSNAVEPLTNGNYVVGSRGWTNPNGQLAFAGAATWCNGMTGTVGLVTASNSLIGGRADDQIGSSVTALTNGNYVVGSSLWDDPTGPVENVGAVTFCNGMSGLTGLVTTANSLTGGTTGDRVGSPAVTALTNGNYVVLTESWDNPTGPVANVGAATWGNGITGTVGLVTAGNSLIGGTANDMVGQGSVVKALANGNYIVGVSNWDNPMGPIVDSGAVTWCNGAGGTVGLVTAGNSLIGGTANDRFGNSFADVITALPDGNYVIQFNLWDNPSGLITDARAVTIGNGTGGSVGLITSVNSVLGTVTNGISSPGFLVPGFAYDNTSGRLFVGRAASNIVSIFNCPFCTIPPTITSCPENQSVNADAGQCTASVSFNPTATGLPAPAITCKVDATTITSPHNFPVGTSNVICTASNGIAPDATCSFTVTVTASSPPVLSYSSPQMAIPGQSLMISPATGPSDDGSVASIVVQNVTLNAPTPVTVTVDNTTGVVTVPSNMPPGSYTVIIRATDNCGAFTDATFTLNVACMAVTVNPPTLPNGFVGALYTQALGATGGTPGYTFTLDSGAFPPGLDIAGSNLTGTPTAAGVFNFTIKANDSGNCMGTQVYTVVISGNGLQFYPLAHPVRLVDTRIGGSACQTPGAQITGGTSLTVPARGVCGGLTIPVNAAAVTGNVTTVGATANGFLTIYPSTATQPSASNSNYQAGQTLNNVFTAGLGAADGAFKIFSVQTTDVIVDVTGYFAPPGAGGLFFHPLPAPVRLLDTREMQTACTTPETPVLAGMEFLQQGNAICGIPASAVALVGNAITVGPAAQGFLTLFASNEARPLVASGNYAAGQTLNSPFTVSLSPSGNFTIYSLQQTDLVVDVLGYYSAEVSDATGIGLLFSPLTSARLLDTRPLLPGCFTPGVEISAMTETSQAAREVCGIPATAQAIVGNVTTVGPAAQGFLTFWPSNVTRPNAATSNFAAGVNFNRHFTVGLGADGAFKMYALTSTHLVIDVSGSFAP